MSAIKDFKDFNRKITISTIAAILVAIIGGVAIGCVMGYKIHEAKHRCPVQKHAVGYSVLTSNKVVTCCKDTVNYQWNKPQH